MQKKPNILITNDDGIAAPGIRYLWEALKDSANLFIVAPETEKSCVGLSITIRDPIQIFPVTWEQDTPAWKVTGTPADCVRLGMSLLLNVVPDLIVSGINRGGNAGRTVLYSGTIGGVIEGTLRNIPGIAFSCTDYTRPDYAKAVPFIKQLVHHVLEHPLPAGTLLNVNFPEQEILGVKLARQGKSLWIEAPEMRTHPHGHSYYWHGLKWHEQDECEDSDVHVLRQGYASAVPIQVHELTDLRHFEEHREVFKNKFN